ncbi:hypothetical protein D0Y65_023780 [Glycine soja]|uniref:Uncharacterized protein n=1 Tax=Glycine soja TaxID=3848 RepID=A0A445IZH7_GLYSO|nr:hypothetical protein D0Y65_023780 [Glycine soja]
MGTREVYEEKLRTGNLHHDPTINPGLGSARCPRCLSLLNPNSVSLSLSSSSQLYCVLLRIRLAPGLVVCLALFMVSIQIRTNNPSLRTLRLPATPATANNAHDLHTFHSVSTQIPNLTPNSNLHFV